MFRLKFTFLRFDFRFLYKFSSLPLLKMRHTPLSNSEFVNVSKNAIDFCFDS